MSLPTNRYNRRQFLERSMLGFGGAFLLPSLLASCTDHVIPPSDPNLPTIPPLLGDDDFPIDWNDTAKVLVKAGLEAIPGAGEILGPLVDILWPKNKEDVWPEIRERVEQLVDQKIVDSDFTDLQEDLSDLNGDLNAYFAVAAGDQYSKTETAWNIAEGFFNDRQNTFKASSKTADVQLLYLPLYTQYTNLYLGLLRQGLVSSAEWGWDTDTRQIWITKLQNQITDSINWVNNTYNVARYALQQRTAADNHTCEPFRTVNTFDREMTISVLDYAALWPYFDVTLYPNGTPINLTREIYSDPIGDCSDSGNIVIQQPPPPELPTNITLWAHDRIDAVEVSYPGYGLPRMGNQPDGKGSGTNNLPPAASLDLSPDNPITQAIVNVGVYESYYIPNSVIFRYQDGTQSAEIGGGTRGYNNAWTPWISYPENALSRIHINGVDKINKTADCIVFGFLYRPSAPVTLEAVRRSYIASVEERSAEKLAKAFPKANIPADFITEDLKAARKEFWESVKARATGPR